MLWVFLVPYFSIQFDKVLGVVLSRFVKKFCVDPFATSQHSSCAKSTKSSCGRQSRSNSTRPNSKKASPGPSQSEICAVSNMPKRKPRGRRGLQPPHQEQHHLLELSLPDLPAQGRLAPEARAKFLKTIVPHSPRALWYINMLGEYDLLKGLAAGQHGVPCHEKSAHSIIPENWEPPKR
ncbi:MAG: hypothetical protein OXF88_02050 [Rhodobacteraceae bacterium]|nr:hypothetical protein [Paracoccaceae bacterium]MCY4140644.1 hypothetical protein [Paracoccaceae bacterium]